MARLLTAPEVADQFCDFRRAFRLEVRPTYWMGYEQAEFTHFHAGQPRPPEQVPWWQEYLARVEAWRDDGREVCRVRLDDEDDSPYQQWLRWCEPYHRQAGENILHMPRSLAASLGIPGYDFWLFEDDDGSVRLLLMLFDQQGKPTQHVLIDRDDAPDLVGQHLAWRDLAVRSATATAAAA